MQIACLILTIPERCMPDSLGDSCYYVDMVSSKTFKPDLERVPNSSGVYLMYGKIATSAGQQNRNDDKGKIPASAGMTREGKVIYVGKAINLRKRVSSYWKQIGKQSIKTQALIKQVAKLDFIATDTEAEALILENELIKKYQPQYNVLLRDDKTFQYIRVGLDQKFPEITVVRRVNPHDIKSRESNRPRYFGPYTSGGAVKNTLKLINSIFPICGKAHQLNLKKIPDPDASLRSGMTEGSGKARELNRRLPRSDESDLAMTPEVENPTQPPLAKGRRGGVRMIENVSLKAPCLNYQDRKSGV